MTNIDLIKNVDLKNNLISLKREIIEEYIKMHEINSIDMRDKIDKLIYNHVLGIGRPISICDGNCYLAWSDGEKGIHIGTDLIVELIVDYRVTSGYKPYQPLDKLINLKFRIDRQLIRDYKIDQIS